MSLTLDLPLELECELSVEAQRLNLPLSEYILRLLTTNRVRTSNPKTAAELVDYWRREGLIGTHHRGERIEESDLVAMASDPDIQHELRHIEHDFAETELDGLDVAP